VQISLPQEEDSLAKAARKARSDRQRGSLTFEKIHLVQSKKRLSSMEKGVSLLGREPPVNCKRASLWLK